MRETASTQRSFFDKLLIDHVAIGGVRLVHQRSAIDRDGDIYFARLQRAVHRGGAIALNEDLRVGLRLETVARESDAVGADGEIDDVERAV